MLTLKNIQYAVRTFHLIVNNFNISENTIHTLVGTSGSGKTTLLNLIAGHLTPTAGEMMLNSKDLLKIPIHKRNIGLIFQESLLFPHMNVYENIAYPLRIKKTNSDIIDKKVNLLLEEVGLEGYNDRKVSELSGGQKKRVAIARTLATNPSLLLMDEPLNSLDPQLKDSILKLIKKIKEKNNLAILFVTHDFDEALKVSDEISVIDNGRIIHSGSTQELLYRPQSLDILNFFPYYNIVNLSSKGRIRENLTPAGEYIGIIPPQGISLSPGEKGTIEKITRLSYGIIYAIRWEKQHLSVFSRKENFKLHDKVQLTFDLSQVTYKRRH